MMYACVCGVYRNGGYHSSYACDEESAWVASDCNILLNSVAQPKKITHFYDILIETDRNPCTARRPIIELFPYATHMILFRGGKALEPIFSTFNDGERAAQTVCVCVCA